MEKRLEDALTRLRGKAKPPPSPRGAAAARDLRDRYGLRLPEDFAAYLEEGWAGTDGTEPATALSWWEPERIRSLRDECGTQTPGDQQNEAIEQEADKYLVFADYLDWCYAYALCCSEGPNRGKVAIVGTHPDRFAAGSFLSFVELAAADSDRLHSPAGDRYTDLIERAP